MHDNRRKRVVRQRRCRGNDFIVAPYAEHQQGQVQSRGAARQGASMRHTDFQRHLLLESIDMGPEGGDPIGFESFFDEAQLFTAHVGGRKIDTCHG